MAEELCHFQLAKLKVVAVVALAVVVPSVQTLCTNSMGNFNFLISIDKKVPFSLILYLLP